MQRRDLQVDQVSDDLENVRSPSAAFFASKNDEVHAVRSYQFWVLVELLPCQSLNRFAVFHCREAAKPKSRPIATNREGGGVGLPGTGSPRKILALER